MLTMARVNASTCCRPENSACTVATTILITAMCLAMLANQRAVSARWDGMGEHSALLDQPAGASSGWWGGTTGTSGSGLGSCGSGHCVAAHERVKGHGEWKARCGESIMAWLPVSGFSGLVCLWWAIAMPAR
jgi:hypothetical protein